MTSGEYGYLILKKLQYYTSCSDSYYRAYLYNFYGEIINDPSVVINGENYKEFCDLMDYEMDYAAKNNYTTPRQMYNDKNFSTNYILLQNSFAAIGIDLDMTENGDGPLTLIFTLPNGKVKILDGLQDHWYNILIFHPQLGVTDEYFKQTLPYIEGEMGKVEDLAIVGTQSAGYNTYWTYNENTKTIEITGEGTLVNFLLWKELNITDVKTLIVGSGVYRILSNAFTSNRLTIVDFHGEYDQIFIEPQCAYNVRLIIYSDNLILRSYNWSDYAVSVELHNLSEWDEQ